MKEMFYPDNNISNNDIWHTILNIYCSFLWTKHWTKDLKYPNSSERRETTGLAVEDPVTLT
jgi:hypothetical protein